MDKPDNNTLEIWVKENVPVCFEYINGETENGYVQGYFDSGIHTTPKVVKHRRYGKRKFVYFNELKSINEVYISA